MQKYQGNNRNPGINMNMENQLNNKGQSTGYSQY